ALRERPGRGSDAGDRHPRQLHQAHGRGSARLRYERRRPFDLERLPDVYALWRYWQGVGLEHAEWHPRAVEGILVPQQGFRGHQHEFRADEPRLRGRPDGQGEQLWRKAGLSVLAAAVEKDSRPVDHLACGDAGRAEALRDESVRSRAEKVYTGEESPKWLGALRDERRDHAGERIGHAGPGQAGIAR